jgi:adenylosuccinate lyase
MNMKTLSDLKRDLVVGTQLVMVYNHNTDTSERIKSLLNVPRYIIKKNTTGVVLSPDKDATKGSHLEYPAKATLCEYTGDTLSIYEAGIRPLTAQEQAIRDNVPSRRKENAEAVHNEMLTDGSGFYWKDKQYYKDNDAEYLAGHETVRGLRYNYNDQNIIDETIKGTLSLKYNILK